MTYNPKTLNEYRRRIEPYEKNTDPFILPEVYLAVRTDAHRVFKDRCRIPDSDYPFHDLMNQGLLYAAQFTMKETFQIPFAYIHGDEICFVCKQSESFGQRRRGKITATVASAVAISLSDYTDSQFLCDAKVAELPTLDHVVDYLFWQRRSAFRNYHSRKIGVLMHLKGFSDKQINEAIAGLTELNARSTLEALGHPLDSVPSSYYLGTLCWITPPSSEPDFAEEPAISSSVPSDDTAFYSSIAERMVELEFQGTPKTSQQPTFVPKTKVDTPKLTPWRIQNNSSTKIKRFR